jgi:hypothetical protein
MTLESDSKHTFRQSEKWRIETISVSTSVTSITEKKFFFVSWLLTNFTDFAICTFPRIRFDFDNRGLRNSQT